MIPKNPQINHIRPQCHCSMTNKPNVNTLRKLQRTEITVPVWSNKVQPPKNPINWIVKVIKLNIQHAITESFGDLRSASTKPATVGSVVSTLTSLCVNINIINIKCNKRQKNRVGITAGCVFLMITRYKISNQYAKLNIKKKYFSKKSSHHFSTIFHTNSRKLPKIELWELKYCEIEL